MLRRENEEETSQENERNAITKRPVYDINTTPNRLWIKKKTRTGTTGFGLFFLLPIGFFKYPVFLTQSQHTNQGNIKPTALKKSGLLLKVVHLCQAFPSGKQIFFGKVFVLFGRLATIRKTTLNLLLSQRFFNKLISSSAKRPSS